MTESLGGSSIVQACSDGSVTRPPTRAAYWCAVALVAVAVIWTGAMMASLHWLFLDRFSASMPDGRTGVDFFQMPRGFKNLFCGNSIFLTELSQFGPHSTPYMAHPAAAIAVGSWALGLGPWGGYYAFVGLSLGLLLLAGRLLASVFEGPGWKAFAYFAMFCSIPVYYMLWAGQIHVVLVLAVALVLTGLMRLESDEPNAARYVRWIQAGILISLLSKPIVIFMFPVLLLTRETRRCVLPPVLIYTVISLLFLVVPELNPGGYNGRHWANMLMVSLTPKPFYWLSIPAARDLTERPELYALPTMFHRFFGHPLPSLVANLPAAVILATGALPLLLPARSARIRAAVVTVCLCVLMHYLAYYAVFEYQYTTLLPLLPATGLALAAGKGAVGGTAGFPALAHGLEARAALSHGLDACTAATVDGLLRGFAARFSAHAQLSRTREPDRYWLPNSMLRVFPALIAFVCLARYAAALGWPAVRRWARRWYAVRNTSPHSAGKGLTRSTGKGWPSAIRRLGCGPVRAWADWSNPFAERAANGLISGAVAAAAFGIVLLAAFETSPTRIWKTPDNWTRLGLDRPWRRDAPNGRPYSRKCSAPSTASWAAATCRWTATPPWNTTFRPSTPAMIRTRPLRWATSWSASGGMRKPKGATAKLPRPTPTIQPSESD